MKRALGNKLIRFPSVSSTNETMKELLQDGVISGGAVITATTQTQGRGRLDREWASPEGGLWMSVLLELDTSFEGAMLGMIPLMAGASVATAIIMETDLDAGLKWPNDVLVNGRKACGILAELVVMGDIRYVIVGIGINVNNRMREGYDFSDTSTSLAEEFGRSVSMEVLENTILEELSFRAELLSQKEYRKILDDWRELSETLGRRVRVVTPAGEFTGMAKDIDDTGALLIDMDGDAERISVGDCRHLD